MTLLFLSGCAPKVKVTDADLYIQVKAAQAEAQVYQNTMKATKDRLTAVLPELSDPDPQPEPSMLIFVDGFLALNDCTKATTDSCYRKTRALLINLADRYDEEAELYYGTRKTLNSMINNLSFVIDNMGSPIEHVTKK